MSEELIVNYDSLNEVEATIREHQTKGLYLMRHNCEKKTLHFKKIPLEEELARVME
jgi:hypothetical protein